MTRKRLPKFANEAAERAFYDAHPDDFEDYFEEPSSADRARVAAIMAKLPSKAEGLRQADAAMAKYLPPSQPIKLRIPTADLALARELAARKGIGYQTLLKMFIHEALQREVGS
jgi:hypothetical protein